VRRARRGRGGVRRAAGARRPVRRAEPAAGGCGPPRPRRRGVRGRHLARGARRRCGAPRVRRPRGGAPERARHGRDLWSVRLAPEHDRAALTLRTPEFTDVLEARRTIEPHLRQTPLRAYHGLSELLGAEVLVKHENHLPTGAFKVRGGVNLVAHLTPEERGRGLVTASTGNHGQSIAFAARLFA